MQLGLKIGSLSPILGYRSPVTWLTFLVATILNFAISSGFIKEEPRKTCQKKKQILQVPCKGAPSMFPQQGPYGDMLRLHSEWFTHSFISDGVPQKTALPRNAGKI
jgi:hypothetical protein